MDSHLSSVPWYTLALWQEANACLVDTMQQNQSVLAEPRRQAQRMRRRLEGVFPLMERLCRKTCPDCKNICCRRAWVWADFKDLLFLHLAGIPVPDQQLIDRQGGHCRYGSPDGCRLDRIRRPFVCTWYLCPAQTRLLDHQSAEKHRLASALHRIKEKRRQMEDAFIQAMMA